MQEDFEFIQEELCEISTTCPVWKKAVGLVKWYYESCDRYDIAICGNDRGRPTNDRENHLIQKNAREYKKELYRMSAENDIPPELIKQAMVKYHVR